MLKYQDGEYVEMTDEEIEALEGFDEPAIPTLEERLAQLEALLAERGLK